MNLSTCLFPITLIQRFVVILWLELKGLAEWFKIRSWIAKDVSREVVLITGAGSGLGRDIALEFAKLGSSLVLWDINQEGLEVTKQMIRDEQAKLKPSDDKSQLRSCSSYIVDVSKREKVQEFAKIVFTDLNRELEPDSAERYVSVLVNNAGIYYGKYLMDLKDEQIERIFNINILAHFWTVRAFLPKMIEHQKGHLVEIASMAGMCGMFKQVDYCATKFANVGFEESLSLEFYNLGLADKIKVTSVCPLFFSSNLFTDYDSHGKSLMSSKFVAKETVLTMRCNHSRVLLPCFTAYSQFIFRGFLTREAIYKMACYYGYDDGLKNIKGTAASAGPSA